MISNIYKIDLKHHQFTQIDEIDNVILKIIEITAKNRKKKKDDYHVSRNEINQTSIILVVENPEQKESEWAKFLPKEHFEEITLYKQSLNLLLFIYTYENLYCIIGGDSYSFIVNFIDHSFGINSYSKIIDQNQDNLISIKSKGVSGNEINSNSQFREDFKVINFIRFGKIPYEIIIRTSIKNSIEYFHRIQNNPNERIIVNYGKGVKINKDLNFYQIISVAKQFDYINNLEESEFLNSYKEIDKKSIEIQSFYDTLINNIFNDLENLSKTSGLHKSGFQFDFTNPNNTVLFFESDTFHLKEKTSKGGYSKFYEVNDKNKIYSTVLNRAVEVVYPLDFFSFRAYIQGVQITCYKEGKKTVSSNFLFHFNTEVSYKGDTLIYLGSKWYKLKSSFIKELNSTCESILSNYKAPDNLLFEPWKKKEITREGDYNLLYKKVKGYFVLDTYLFDYIEICDILKINDDSISLIHVKYGFDNKLREVINQVLISARRLKNDMQGSNIILKKIFRKLIDTEQINIINCYTEDTFISEFKNKRIEYVIAFTNHNNEKPILGDISNFKSSIAKFSIIECNTEMQTNYFPLNFLQIKNL